MYQVDEADGCTYMLGWCTYMLGWLGCIERE